MVAEAIVCPDPRFTARETDAGWAVYDHQEWRRSVGTSDEEHVRNLAEGLNESPRMAVYVEWKLAEVAA
jgi:hypothetical protein